MARRRARSPWFLGPVLVTVACLALLAPASPASGSGTLQVTPKAKEFGLRVVDWGPTQPQAFTVTNTGATTAQIDGLVLGGPDPGAFAITSDPCSGSSLGGGESCVAELIFDPSVLGDAHATLSFEAGDSEHAGASLVTADLYGTGKPVPPDCLSPVTVRKTPRTAPGTGVRSGKPVVRARFESAYSVQVSLDYQVTFSSGGKKRKFSGNGRSLTVTGGFGDLEVPVPRKLWSVLKPGKKVNFKVRYRSRGTLPPCGWLAPEMTRTLHTAVVRVSRK